MKQAVFVDPDGMALVHAPSGALLVPDFPLRERAFASEVNCTQRLRIVALLWNLRTTGLAEASNLAALGGHERLRFVGL